MTFTKMLVVVALTIFAGHSDAKSSQHKTAHFADIVNVALKDPLHTLVVMDNDDTLSMMPCPSPEQCQYLGGAAWFSWQEDLLKHDPQNPLLVANTFEQLLEIATVLFALNHMDFVEPSIPSSLNTLADKGVRLLVETARGTPNVAATQMQFSQLEVDTQGTTLQQLINAHSLKMPYTGDANLAGAFQPCAITNARPVSYLGGVMYVAGQNKGVMLQCLLTHYNNTSIPHTPHLNVKAYHYTALKAHKKALTEGHNKNKLQQQVTEAWLALKVTFESVLAKPAVDITQ